MNRVKKMKAIPTDKGEISRLQKEVDTLNGRLRHAESERDRWRKEANLEKMMRKRSMEFHSGTPSYRFLSPSFAVKADINLCSNVMTNAEARDLFWMLKCSLDNCADQMRELLGRELGVTLHLELPSPGLEPIEEEYEV